MELMFDTMANLREIAWELTHERKTRRAKMGYHGAHRQDTYRMPLGWQMAFWLMAVMLFGALIFGTGLG
jgi:hypothetical protein